MGRNLMGRTFSAAEVEALEQERLEPQQESFGMQGEMGGFRPVAKKRTFSADEINAIEQKLGRKLYNPLETAAMHAAKGRAYGLTPQIAGLGGALNEVPYNPRESEAMGFDPAYLGSGKPPLEGYREARDQYQGMEQDAAKDNPNAAILGSLVGLGSLPQANPIRQGAAINAGYSDADVTKGEFGKLALDTSLGAIGGAAGQAVAPLVSKGVDAAKAAIQKMANERALNAVAGKGNSAQYRRMLGITKANPGDPARIQAKKDKLATDIRAENVISPFDKIDDIGHKVYEAQSKYGSQMQAVSKEIDALTPVIVDMKKIATRIREFADKQVKTRRGKKIANELYAEAEAFDEMGMVSFAEAQKVKNDFKWKATDQDALISNSKIVNKLNSLVGDEMEHVANAVANYVEDPASKALISQWKDLKSKYATFASASKASVDRGAVKNKQLMPFSLQDLMIGSAAGLGQAVTHGDLDPKSLIMGGGAAMGSRMLRQRGPAFTAYTLDKGLKAANKIGPKINKQAIFSHYLGDKMKSGLEGQNQSSALNELEQAGIPVQRLVNTPYLQRLEQALAQGPKTLAITHYLLSHQDPGYQNLLENDKESDNTAYSGNSGNSGNSQDN